MEQEPPKKATFDSVNGILRLSRGVWTHEEIVSVRDSLLRDWSGKSITLQGIISEPRQLFLRQDIFLHELKEDETKHRDLLLSVLENAVRKGIIMDMSNFHYRGLSTTELDEMIYRQKELGPLPKIQVWQVQAVRGAIIGALAGGHMDGRDGASYSKSVLLQIADLLNLDIKLPVVNEDEQPTTIAWTGDVPPDTTITIE